MPLYEYECKGGHKFEQFKHRIEDRYNGTCPLCKKSVQLRISVVRYRLAEPMSVYLADGTTVQEFRDAPKIRPPTPPEELIRVGVLSNSTTGGLR